ncbi:MAG: ATP-binding protein [Candidatus Saccharimonadales bacterium]
MDLLQQLLRTIRIKLFVVLAVGNLALVGGSYAAVHYTSLSLPLALAAVLAGGMLFGAITARLLGSYLIQPLRALWQTVLHLSTSTQGVAAPEIHKIKLGRDFVSHLQGQIHQMTSVAESAARATEQATNDVSRNFIARNLPVPLLTLDNTETITYANDSMADYLGIKPAELIGKNIYFVMDLAFPSTDTLDTWLKQSKTKAATASRSWERVKMDVRDNHPLRLFDLAAFYNRDNAQHIETMLVLMDHTKTYSQDDQAISFIALSVHELRTPLTLLRGYIEVFQDELQGKVDPDLLDFMNKMSATAQQLMAFVNNILNVARVDDDQLQLKLQEETWGDILKTSLDTLSLRAGVRGITLEYSLQPDLPTVGVDRLSVYEVLNNLVDNAIKYSNGSKTIKINAHLTKENMVETTIQDFGGGMPPSILPNLFTKYYRDHRNRAQIGGTGLGLYLSKAIITAHGGNIWVTSKENEGTIFGFTLQPFAQLSQEVRDGQNQEIVRSAHGWIKNHSLYRR